jgi:hypothetical protein
MRGLGLTPLAPASGVQDSQKEAGLAPDTLSYLATGLIGGLQSSTVENRLVH